MHTTRRELMLSAGAAAALAHAPAGAFQESTSADRNAERILADMAEQLFREFPESASQFGLDKATRAPLKRALMDRSPEGVAARARAAADRLAQLKAMDVSRLSPAAALDVEVVRAAHELAVQGHHFPYGDVINLHPVWGYRNSPYAVAHNMGAWAEVPDFLDTQHTIATAEDADAYLARLEDYAASLDGETRRLSHDAALGVVAPRFLLDKTIAQLGRARVSAEGNPLVASLARRAGAISGNHAERARRLVADRIDPALARQLEELTRQREGATQDAGAWKLPDGEAYYRWALHAATTTDLTPDEVHQRGLDEFRDLSARMDAILRREGYTKGSVGARLVALGKDPKYLFPNTDEGRARILAYIGERIADIRTRLPRGFATLVPGRLEVRRVPVEIEQGAPGGYAGAGAIDGSVPGFYYINLRDTANWPRYSLPTLTYHEGIPGHIWQGEYTYKLPLIRSQLAFNAYSEGWALYAEQLADELGVYDADPVGRLGYLQSFAFRACRLVVDTGLHAKRWTRDQAIRWFVETNGNSEDEVQGEVDRYCAWPGQACGYKIGHSEILRLREQAKASPGYDLRRFNDAVVLGGSVPMTLLARVIARSLPA